MANKSNEILFNKKNLKTPIALNTVNAKRLFYVLDELNIVEKGEDSTELVNLYTKRINKPSQALTKKILQNDIRPFEFLINRN